MFKVGDYVQILSKIDGCSLSSSRFKIGDWGYIAEIRHHGQVEYGETYAWLSYEKGSEFIGLAFYLNHDLAHYKGQLPLPFK